MQVLAFLGMFWGGSSIIWGYSDTIIGHKNMCFNFSAKEEVFTQFKINNQKSVFLCMEKTINLKKKPLQQEKIFRESYGTFRWLSHRLLKALTYLTYSVQSNYMVNEYFPN